MSHQDKALEVWLDCDLGPPCLVGTLAHDRGQLRFRYERAWLRDARAFSLDPRPIAGRGTVLPQSRARAQATWSWPSS